MRSLLDDQTSLLVYSLGQERSHAWVLTRSSLHSAVLPGREQVEDLARKMYDVVSAGRRRELEAPLRRAIDDLSAAVLAPVSKHLTTSRVAIVADGALQYVPFAALTTGKASEALVARHELVSLPSVSVLEVLRAKGARDASPRSVAVFADPVLEATDPRLRATTQIASAKPVVGQTGVSALQADLLRSGEQSGVGTFQRLPYTSEEADGIL